MMRQVHKNVSFSWAFEHIHMITANRHARGDSMKVAMRLPFWNPTTRVMIQMPDENSKMSHPYFYVESEKGCVPWIPTYPEMFSHEWVILDEAI